MEAGPFNSMKLSNFAKRIYYCHYYLLLVEELYALNQAYWAVVVVIALISCCLVVRTADLIVSVAFIRAIGHS